MAQFSVFLALVTAFKLPNTNLHFPPSEGFSSSPSLELISQILGRFRRSTFIQKQRSSAASEEAEIIDLH
jgi:hypothetical protein